MVAVVVGLAVGLLAAAPQFIGDNVVTSRGWWISAIAIVGALPTAASLAAIQRLARKPLPGPVGAQLSLLMHLRRTLSRLLNELGLLVILVMAVNGAAWTQNRAQRGDLRRSGRLPRRRRHVRPGGDHPAPAGFDLRGAAFLDR